MKRFFATFIFTCIFLCACAEASVSETPDLSAFKQVTVSRVVDGDTFIYMDGSTKVRVRCIGIDTPESVAPEDTSKENTEEGVTASDFVKALIDGQTVYLEYDAGKYDTYNRELAYVYLTDGTMLQELLLEMGYAKTMTIQPNVKYADRFAKLQKTARENKVGFWDGYFE